MEFFVKLKYVLIQLRWYQWYKGLLVFFALFLVPHEWKQYIGLLAVGAFTFNITSSIVYLINDLNDIPLDKKHPHKKFRPLASGKISLFEAFSLMVTLIGLLFILIGYISNSSFSMLILAYLLGNLLYTYFVKHIPYLDIVSISTFAGMRVAAGFLLIGMPISWFLVLLVASFYFFLVSVYRSVEMQLTGVSTRPVLKHYNQRVLSFFITATLIASVTLYFMAMALTAFPLIYTDIIYFFILFYIYEFIGDLKSNKKDMENPFLFLVHHRWLLSLCALLGLAVLTLVIWYY